jgi:hypothetical protein
MKTFTILVLSLCCLGASASSWRVNSNTEVSADFVSITEAVAHWTVEDGDTLYLENGSYFAATSLTKSLTLIGPGYFLLENDSTYANPLPVLIQSLSLGNESSGSKIIGVTIIGIVSISISNDINNITIERSHLGGFSFPSSNRVVSGLIIRQCYVAGNISGAYIASSAIHNNIILGTISLTSGSHNIYNNVIYFNSTGTTYALAARNSSVINNIIIREPVLEDPNLNRTEYCIDFASASNSNTSFARNVVSQSPNASFPDNMYNVEKENLFTLSGSMDKKWKLKTASPAIGFGSNGDDCGAYGGAMYYVPSGLPWLLPRIFEAQIPSSGSGNNIPVHIKATIQGE